MARTLIAVNDGDGIILKEKGMGRLFYAMPTRVKTLQAVKNWLHKYNWDKSYDINEIEMVAI